MRVWKELKTLNYQNYAEKQLISYPTLNDKNGDASKDWYVEYSFRLPGDDQLHRYRICGGIRRTVPTDSATR